jgi:uncharacterized RDD family membrane protein YckC
MSNFQCETAENTSLLPIHLRIMKQPQRPMQWHYLQNDKTFGPVSHEELDVLIQAGTVSPDVLVWAEGMPDWRPYAAVNASADVAAPVERAGLRIASHRPEFPQESPERLIASARASRPTTEIAPLGHRIVAKLIDFAALAICVVVIAIIFQWIWSLVKQSAGTDKQALKSIIRIAAVAVGFLLALFYKKTADATASSIGNAGRRSPGKRIMELHVVDATGRPVGFSTKLARTVIQMLMVGGIFLMCLLPLTAMTHMSGMRRPPPAFGRGPGPPTPFGSPARTVGRFFSVFAISLAISQAGYAVALFHPQRRGLHDLLCGTRVIYKP